LTRSLLPKEIDAKRRVLICFDFFGCTGGFPSRDLASAINLSTMTDPAKLAQLDAAIPLGRMARPEEIANVVAFLAGDGASYVTATTVFADGGIMHSSVGL
jgi:glucose 1-dehydrogenase